MSMFSVKPFLKHRHVTFLELSGGQTDSIEIREWTEIIQDSINMNTDLLCTCTHNQPLSYLHHFIVVCCPPSLTVYQWKRWTSESPWPELVARAASFTANVQYFFSVYPSNFVS